MTEARLCFSLGQAYFLTLLLLQIHEMPFEIFKDDTYLKNRLKAEENEQ